MRAERAGPYSVGRCPEVRQWRQRTLTRDSRGAAAGAAISLRGVVKRFGSIVAVDGSTWRCRRACASVCSARTAPASRRRCECSPRRRSRTRGDLGARLRAAARVQAGAAGDGRRAAARQPRRRADLSPDPDGVRTPLPRVPTPSAAASGRAALELANLAPRADTIVRELSGGMRRRLLVARGLIHRPRLVLLDEPTVGSTRRSARSCGR